jgi:hypothetical protein
VKFRIRQKQHIFYSTLGSCTPELFLGGVYDGPMVDVWSLRIRLHTTATGSFQVHRDSFSQMEEQFLHTRYDILHHILIIITKPLLRINPHH